MITDGRAGVMDNPYYTWSPITTRPRLSWPDGARVAFAVITTLETMNWYPPAGTVLPPNVRFSRPGAYPVIPDVHTTSPYEYGNRVGAFRVLDVLSALGVRPTVAMDVAVARRSPYLVERLAEADAEFVGHGFSAETMITELMPEVEERQLISGSLDAMTEITGARPRGWIGSEYGESTRTVRLLAEHGIHYVMDWPTGEQPHPMITPMGDIVNLPVAIELDDLFTHVGRSISVNRFTRMITEHFDQLYEDSASSGRVLLLNVHPWIMGQPFRIKYLESAIAHIATRPGVWLATGGEIADSYNGQR
jgi:allantoinase